MKSVRRRAVEILAEISKVPEGDAHVDSTSEQAAPPPSEVDQDVRAFIDLVADSGRPSVVPDNLESLGILEFPTAHSDQHAGSNNNVDLPGYKLGHEIGRGGQAVVYSGYQISTGLRVAIKILIGGSLISPQSMARFDRESKILGSLNHPNIVKIVDRGLSMSGEPFIVMNFVQGERFDRWLTHFRKQNGPILKFEDLQTLLALFLKICDAINAAHLRGVIHRDIKPSNILIDEQGSPHVLDFGLARTLLRTMTDEQEPRVVSTTGEFIGSLPWASPEQAQGCTSELDMRTDVYSLGVMAYQILTGEFPYDVTSPMPAVLQSILHDVPLAPSKRVVAILNKIGSEQLKKERLNDSTIVALDAIVLKALAKSRTDRQQTAGELCRDVKANMSIRPSVLQSTWATACSKVSSVLSPLRKQSTIRKA